MSTAQSTRCTAVVLLLSLAVVLLLGTNVDAQQPAAHLPTLTPAQPASPAPLEATPAATAPGSAPPPIRLSDIEAGSAFDFMPHTPVTAGGLTEAHVVRKALSESSRVRSADAAAETARRRADRAYAVFMPRVELSARYTRLSNVPVPASFRDFFPVLLDNYSLRAAVRVPVSDYFVSLRDRYDSAHRLQAVQDLQRRAEHHAVAHDARMEYFQLARAMAADSLSRHRVTQLERFTAEIGILVQGGELGIVSLALARSRLATARAAAERDAANRRVAEEVVRRRLALPLGAPVGIAEPLAAPAPEAPVDLTALLHEADRKRPEVLALRELISAHTHTRDAVAAGRYPTLSVVGDLAYENPNQRFMPPRDEFNGSWSIGAELSWSPTDLAVRNDELDESRLALTRAQQDLDGLRSAVIVEITRAYEQTVSATASLKAYEEAVAAAEQAHEAQLELFRAGETTSRQVLDAELDLRAAQLQWVDGVLAVHMAKASLDRAVGREPR
ncbi:MAG: TolC family protein [Myxococcales bacterium]|nr:TolC family protein [Myxococcales bacterium]